MREITGPLTLESAQLKRERYSRQLQTIVEMAERLAVVQRCLASSTVGMDVVRLEPLGLATSSKEPAVVLAPAGRPPQNDGLLRPGESPPAISWDKGPAGRPDGLYGSDRHHDKYERE